MYLYIEIQDFDPEPLRGSRSRLAPSPPQASNGEPRATAHQSVFERASSVDLSCFSFDLASFIFIQTKSPSV